MLTKNINATLIIELKIEVYMLKEIGKINKKLDEATRDIGQEANKLVGTEISQALKPNASRHKDALK